MEKQGERIKGSRYFRGFCCVCHDPIRTFVSESEPESSCDDCRRKPIATDFANGAGGGKRVIKSSRGLS